LSRLEFVYYEDEECEDSLFIFNKENPFRKFLYKMLKNVYFRNVMNCVLLISLMNMGA